MNFGKALRSFYAAFVVQCAAEIIQSSVGQCVEIFTTYWINIMYISTFAAAMFWQQHQHHHQQQWCRFSKLLRAQARHQANQLTIFYMDINVKKIAHIFSRYCRSFDTYILYRKLNYLLIIVYKNWVLLTWVIEIGTHRTHVRIQKKVQ